jgi:Xaa-Pro aminopeptidase
VRDYGKVVEDVAARAAAGSKFWLDPASTSLALSTAAGDSVLAETSPIVLAKARKNEAELDGMREAHLKDGVALSSFLCWLEARVNGPDGSISEVDAAEMLETFRAAQDGFLATSFDTIAGSGPNGAIIHYSAEASTCRMVSNSEVFLLDSGGQYLDGTTDVTRTVHLGTTASLHERECFTRVLQGHMAIDSAIFPRGTTGFMIDAFARRPLWSVGLDYRHGTGHGVGACLNVHEGPHSISPRIGSNKAQLLPGMIVSNEPGYYEDGSFGIRIENLLIVVEKSTPNKFAGNPFYGFERLTYVPIEKSMLVPEILSAAEVEWLDGYHEEVWTKLSPRMGESSREREWLWIKTRPLLARGRNP